jgi:hypothetical protein
MKSRDYRILASALAAFVMVLGLVELATAQSNASVKGSGTANTIPVWTDSGTIGNSTITQSGSNVSVGGSVNATSFTGNGSGLTNVNAATLAGFSPSSFAQVGNSNTFTADQTINGNLNLGGSLALPNTIGPNTGVVSFGGSPFLHNFGSDLGNTFVGLNAGNFTVTGSVNTAVGYLTLTNNSSGVNNTAVGGAALSKNTTGYQNTAVGVNALFNNTTGPDNTAVGISVLSHNQTGEDNTAIGAFALQSSQTGQNNTAIGSFALTLNQTGQGNTAIGFNAGSSLVGGESENIDIGDSVIGVVGESNTIRIGNGHQSRTFIAGISGVTTGLTGAAVLVDGNGQLGTISSSRRFKDDIQDMGAASTDLMKLRPVTFRYKQAQEDGSHPLQYGLVAEEVAEVNPALVQFDKDGNPQTVLYHILPAMLLNEVQKEHQKIEDQEKLIQSQHQEIQSQQEQLKAQEERLRKLEAILSSKAN